MRQNLNRRTATKIKDGKVQRKNRHKPTSAERCVIDRESPGRGQRHVVTKRDVHAFIELIPDWPKLSERLERIVLSAQERDWDGFYEFFHREETGAIYLTAWDEDLWGRLTTKYFAEHRMIFERIGLSFDEEKEGVFCRFTEKQARAFSLLHVFMHELGHHYDRQNQKHHGASRGEDFAERFAMSRFESIYPAYVRHFGDPAREND